jgi:hypothetical protein
MDESRAVGSNGSLRWVSRGLITYGIIGLIVAAIGFGAMVWVNDRISTLRTEAEANAAQLATAMGLSATVVRGGSSTAQSFGNTADQAAAAVSSAAVTSAEVRSDLSALEEQLRGVSFLGATPLASSADAVGRITASMEGLDAQLSLIADGLKANRDALQGDASSLRKLGDSIGSLAARLGPGAGQGSLADIQQVIAVTLLMFAAWSFVPAAGALLLGVILRRELHRSRSR